MILDALTRAEHERQLEKQPDLKFVTPVKPQKNSPNKIWIWVGFAVLVNALILLLIVRTLSGGAENDIPEASVSTEPQQPAIESLVMNESIEAKAQQPSQTTTGQTLDDKSLLQESTQMVNDRQQEIQNTLPVDTRPLAMEANSVQMPEVDRPLLYESKQPSLKAQVAIKKSPAKVPNPASGNVSFSSTELSADDAIPVINKPKLLIDGVSNRGNSSNVQNVRDLPESSRANLNQYEVNVHVFDDDPIRRFVLINMDKYKEGDRIVNNGPLVEEITPAGVVVDYGNGRALLPPK